MKPGKFNKDQISRIFDPDHRIVINSDVLKQSAVLIILCPDSNGSFSLILTERNKKLSKHAGEMSFPGGRIEPVKDKTKIDTALRETQEEIGIEHEEVEILGIMDDIPTMTGYIITPVVAVANKPLEFSKNDSEVVSVFEIPIDFFLDKQYFSDKAINIAGEDFPIYNFNYRDDSDQKHTIWGATAHLIIEFMKKIFQYDPSTIDAKRPPIEKIVQLILTRRQAVAKKVKEKNLKSIKDK